MNSRISPGARRVALAWLPAILYMAAIWVASSLPVAPASLEVLPFNDKGAHFIEFAGLAFLVSHALRGTFADWRDLRCFTVAVLTALLWGTLDEIHQAYVPGRHADVNDIFADAAGAVVGAGAYVLIGRVRRGGVTR